MNVKKCVRALLCLYLTLIISINAVKAQTLKVGDTLPPELWSMPLQVINHPEGKETITLSEYKDKLIILDFWATWCSPCIKSLAKLDTLQKEFKEQLAVIPITYEVGEKVLPFLTKRGFELPSVINNKSLTQYFPHTTIPHYVWIKEGKVLAITDGAYNSSGNVKKILTNQQVKMITKEGEQGFDPATLLKIASDTHFESGLIGQVNYGSGSLFAIRNNGLIRANCSAEGLFRTAFRLDYPFISVLNRVIYELPDSTLFKFRKLSIPSLRTFEEDSVYHEWLKGNTYTYYNRYSTAQPRSVLMEKMKEDVTSYFQSVYGVEMHIENRSVPCYVLKETEGFTDNLLNNGTGEYLHVLRDKPLSGIVKDLALLTDNQPFPIVDETSYKGNVTLKLAVSPDDITLLQKELSLYGLQMTKELREITMVVFKQKSDK